MKRKNLTDFHWQKLSITWKFSVSFGLFLLLIIFISLTSYIALKTLQRQTDFAIFRSTEIQRLVLKMDAELEKARRMERDFFIRYQMIGFEEAQRIYVEKTGEQIKKVVVLSSRLKQLITESEASRTMRESDMNLSYYLSTASRYLDAFTEAVGLVASLADQETGMQAQLEQKSRKLQDLLINGNNYFQRMFWEIQYHEKHYFVTRKRSDMQKAFNTAYVMQQEIETAHSLTQDQKKHVVFFLNEYQGIAEKILGLDVEIASKTREFDLQAESIIPISKELIAMATGEVERARTQIHRTGHVANWVLLIAALTGLLLAGAIATLLNRSITRNVIRLTEAAARLRTGDMAVRTRVDSCDEIGLLAATFNQMADELQILYTSLEKMVITRTHRLQKQSEELEQAKEKAEEANRAKSEFLANMSHELRTPLNAVTGFSQLLSSMVSDEKQKSYLMAIKTAGRSLLTLINDILDLSKIEAGLLEIKYAPVDIKMIFSEIEQIFKLRINEKGLNFLMEIDAALPSTLLLDETRLRQLLLNLMGNAVKFTETGFIKLSAKKITESDKQRLLDICVSVEDTGIGIPDTEHTRIFESFKQHNGLDNKKFGGTGLGLSICKKLSEMMNGFIRVKSNDGEGSVFEIVLKDVGIGVPEVAPIEENHVELNTISFSKATVLIVDDVVSNRDLLKELLLMVNLDVLTAGNGQEALLLIEEQTPDLVIMDIRMPVMTGLEATQRLKRNSETSRIPVIALTASAKLKENSVFTEKIFDGYLTKPVKIEKLLVELSKHIPYTVCEQKTEPSGADSHQIDFHSVERPDELVSILNNEILPTFHSLKGAKVMGAIDKFGERLHELGEKHKISQLVTLGKDLRGGSQIFDIERIERKFQEFPGIVENILNVTLNKNDGRKSRR